MNIVFFGSSDFALPSLTALIKGGHAISCVVTQPDRKKGRGLHLGATPVKRAAEEAHLNIFQPENVNAPSAYQTLKALSPEVCIVVAYGQILSQKILDIPTALFINAHASLLPCYRGAAPINWALIRNEKNTGVTIMKVVRKMDAGPLLLQRACMIKDDDSLVSLEKRVSELAADLLLESIPLIKNKRYTLTPQDESRVTFAPRLTKKDGLILWEKSAQEILGLVRGCAGWPGVCTYYRGKLIKITKVTLLNDYPLKSEAPGQILYVAKDGILVSAGHDCVVIKGLQPEGRREMSAAEFIAGHKVRAGERLSDKA